MGERLNVAEALRQRRQQLDASSNTPNLDLQLLLMKATGQTRAWVLAHPEAELSAAQSQQFRADLRELISGTALPYILGWWEFYGRPFQLTREVLIPRPETELVIEHALQHLHASEVRRALDLGTGSGAVAVTLAIEHPALRLTASDIERGALKLARANAVWYGVEAQIAFVQADLLSPLRGPFDLICANLPYVRTSEFGQLEVARREPARSLDGGPDGLSLIRRALQALPAVLAPRGLALFEIQPDQAAAAIEATTAVLPSAQLQMHRDLAGLDRLLAVRRAA